MLNDKLATRHVPAQATKAGIGERRINWFVLFQVLEGEAGRPATKPGYDLSPTRSRIRVLSPRLISKSAD
jgi:hypothetical protein